MKLPQLDDVWVANHAVNSYHCFHDWPKTPGVSYFPMLQYNFGSGPCLFVNNAKRTAANFVFSWELYLFLFHYRQLSDVLVGTCVGSRETWRSQITQIGNQKWLRCLLLFTTMHLHTIATRWRNRQTAIFVSLFFLDSITIPGVLCIWWHAARWYNSRYKLVSIIAPDLKWRGFIPRSPSEVWGYDRLFSGIFLGPSDVMISLFLSLRVTAYWILLPATSGNI